MATIDGVENVCPRCLHRIPNDQMPGAYMGAISRPTRGADVDGDGWAVTNVEVCSDCGTDEALRDWAKEPPIWPVHVSDEIRAVQAQARRRFIGEDADA